MAHHVSDASRRFGHTVRAIRGNRTQAQLAREAGLSLTYIGEVERGQRMPSLLTVVRIATAFGLKASELIRRAKV
jgi:transcriptional regulator with XRE-family HTH domain